MCELMYERAQSPIMKECGMKECGMKECGWLCGYLTSYILIDEAHKDTQSVTVT